MTRRPPRSEVWREDTGVWRWRCGHAPCVRGGVDRSHQVVHRLLDAHLAAHRTFGFRHPPGNGGNGPVSA